LNQHLVNTGLTNICLNHLKPRLQRKSAPGIYEPILTQRQYSALTGFDPVTTNNLVARNILPVDEVVPGRGRGVRLFTRLRAWEGRIVNE
jgi:hypothetical protein